LIGLKKIRSSVKKRSKNERYQLKIFEFNRDFKDWQKNFIVVKLSIEIEDKKDKIN